MKTGRVRRKARPPAKEQTTAPPTQPSPPKPGPPRPAGGPRMPGGKPARGGLIAAILVGIVGCFAAVMLLFTVFGGKGAKEWVQVTRASGEWTTTVTVFNPQVTTEARWETDCTSETNGVVQVGTCVMKQTDAYNDTLVDEYDEYTYNIYYEETYQRLYEASGTQFTVTQLETDDWWQDNLHHTLEEELDKESCQYTNYTIWVDDPQDASQEIEVYLSECEVWDHVTVYERVYEEKAWCQCDVTSLVQAGQQSDQGTGADIRWPDPAVPAGGRSERSFKGQITFLGDDYTYTTTTEDMAEYQDYLNSQYYIGIQDGKAVTVSKDAPKE
jgi:hypothetical protein